MTVKFVDSLKTVLICCSGFDDRLDPMDVIRKNHEFLVNNLNVKDSGLVGELYQAEVLTREERDSIRFQRTMAEEAAQLMIFLNRKTSEQHQKFLDALDKTKQQHIRSHITGRQRQLLRYCFFFSVVLYFKKSLGNAVRD